MRASAVLLVLDGNVLAGEFLEARADAVGDLLDGAGLLGVSRLSEEGVDPLVEAAARGGEKWEGMERGRGQVVSPTSFDHDRWPQTACSLSESSASRSAPSHTTLTPDRPCTASKTPEGGWRTTGGTAKVQDSRVASSTSSRLSSGSAGGGRCGVGGLLFARDGDEGAKEPDEGQRWLDGRDETQRTMILQE